MCVNMLAIFNSRRHLAHTEPDTQLSDRPRCRHGHLARRAPQAARLDGRPRRVGRRRPGGDGDVAAERSHLLAGEAACPPRSGRPEPPRSRAQGRCRLGSTKDVHGGRRLEGCACGGAQGGGRMGGCASRRSASKLGARAGTGHVHRSRSHWPHPALQAFYPWPADKLDLIGGSRRAYIQENVSTDPRTRPLRASLATCTKAGRRGGRHVEPCIPNRAAHPCMQDGSGAAGQDGWSEQSAAERGAERLRRCLDAFADWPPHVRGEGAQARCSAGEAKAPTGEAPACNPDCDTECRGRGRRQLAATPAAAACSALLPHIPSLPPPPQSCWPPPTLWPSLSMANSSAIQTPARSARWAGPACQLALARWSPGPALPTKARAGQAMLSAAAAGAAATQAPAAAAAALSLQSTSALEPRVRAVPQVLKSVPPAPPSGPPADVCARARGVGGRRRAPGHPHAVPGVQPGAGGCAGAWQGHR